jgi:hypothetical protein
VTNLKRKISVKTFKQNYGVLICKYDLQTLQKNIQIFFFLKNAAQKQKRTVYDVFLLTHTREG